jgi:hypothetical protein
MKGERMETNIVDRVLESNGEKKGRQWDRERKRETERETDRKTDKHKKEKIKNGLVREFDRELYSLREC